MDDANLKEQLRSCQHFHADSELKRVRHKVLNYARKNINAKIVDNNLDHFFNNLECAAKMNPSFGFILRNIEDLAFRYFYTRENKTLLDPSKFVSTSDDLAKLKDLLNKTRVIELCSRERMNTNWSFYNLANLTVFAVLLENFPKGCKEAILPEYLLKNHTTNCLTFEENTRQRYDDKLCLLRALALHLHGN